MKASHDLETMRGLLRGVESLLTRSLRHGLLRAESEAMLRDIEITINGWRRGEQTRSWRDTTNGAAMDCRS